MNFMILITGAGGKTGKSLVKVLSRIENISAFVHHEEHVSVLKSLGAKKVVVGDLRDETAIRSATQDMRAIYHICPNMSPDEIKIGRLLLDAAKTAGVEQFVYHSVLHPQTKKMNHHWQKLRVEEMIFESDIPFTVLQPAPYMQNLFASWKSIIEDNVLRVPYSVRAKFSFVNLEDVAEAAKAVLIESKHLHATYELVGTEPIPHMQVAEILSRALNRNIHAEKEDIDAWISRVKGMDRYAVENLIKMFEYYDQWGLVGNPNVLKWIIKREPTSLETFIDRITREYDS